MAPKKKPKLTKEEIALKKSNAAKARLEKIKKDPLLLAQHKEKERLKYLKKKEKGQRRSVKDMTPREQRKTRKKWKSYSTEYRKNKKRIQDITVNFIEHNTPPSSEVDVFEEQRLPELPKRIRNTDALRAESQRRRRMKNNMLLKQKSTIKMLKKKLNTQQRKYQRLTQKIKKTNDALTPKSKIEVMAKDPTQQKELVKKALFGEVIKTQICNNMAKAKTHKEKTNMKTVLSGQIVQKYKVWRLADNTLTKKKLQFKKSQKKTLTRKNMIVKLIHNFYEDDSNSRNAAGKKECITRNGVKKQKRYLLDSLKNLYKKFLQTSTLTISYSLFCQTRPFWVVPPKLTDRDTCACIVHENMNLKLSALNNRKILGIGSYQDALLILCCDRYSENCLSRKCKSCSLKTLPYAEFDNNQEITVKQWNHVKELIKDPKTQKERFINKYKKQSTNMPPRDLILELEVGLIRLFQHELNIVHQYRVIKSLKESLTEKDAVIHMDFSENFLTKCNKEIQSYHFGGSRTQLSMHTVVVYTKDSTTSHCTISANLSHNVAAIWAHLQPVLASLDHTVENLHFLSDGPVTQYRNKGMFFVLACKIEEYFRNVVTFTWNYHEAGHGKGAPDGVGATCKRTADNIIARNTDITNLNDFVNALRLNCPGIRISIIEDNDIEEVNKMLKFYENDFKSFKGTLQVHQVTGDSFNPNQLKMKSLSCFCKFTCEHYKLGTLRYTNDSRRLKVSEVFTDSDDDIPLHNLRTIEENAKAGPSNCHYDRLRVNYGCGDYVLVKLQLKKKEYRYAAICSNYVDEEGELTVTFLKVCGEKGNLFKLDENDVADVPYEDVIEKLQIPSLIVKGDRVYYKFKKAIEVFEK